MTNADIVTALLTAENIIPVAFADDGDSDTIDLGHINSSQGVIYHMADKTEPIIPAADGKSKSQLYYEEVEELKAQGVANADAIRQVAEKHKASDNAVRGGIYQYKTKHTNGAAATTTTRRRSSGSAPASVDDYVAAARKALGDALALIDREVSEAKTALDGAQARYDEVVSAVAERKSDIEKKLKALS